MDDSCSKVLVLYTHMHAEKKDKEKFPIIHRAALLCFGKVGSGHGSPQHSTPAKGSFICNAPKLCNRQFHGVIGKTEHICP